MSKPIRVLIVDDSALVRTVLSRGFARDKELEVIGVARDPYEARDLLVKLRPDVMTLDIEMPHMDGIDFLRKFMAVMPTPTVVLSSLAVDKSVVAQQALGAGAVFVLAKPKVSVESGLDAAMSTLIAHVKRAASHRVQKRADPNELEGPQGGALDATTDLVIGIGASTGGVAALGRIVPMLPAWTPGVVIVQHIAEGFTLGFAKRLDELCPMEVVEAQDGDRVLRGRVLVAPGGVRHLEVHRIGGEYRVRLRAGPPVSGHTPSVDVLFSSLASHAGKNAFGCLLTGMGSDGAQGLLDLRRAGGRTVIQSQATCAVWGMPAAAQALGAAEQTRGLLEVPAAVMEWARPRGATGS
jgi:two-component system, chemotaxis family, protein-glutamate methylesterase/glutaminase